MRTIRTKVYKFNELSKEAKEKAINNYRNDNEHINDYDFVWDDIKEDAKTIGLKIISLDDHSPNKGEFIINAYDVSCKIVQEHGKDCDTYKNAVEFGKDWSALVEKYSDGINKDKVDEDNQYEFDEEADELEEEFLRSLLEDYRIMYNKDIDYQNSDEAIKETIEANEYEFTREGKMI